jgi:hypothetical protein
MLGFVKPLLIIFIQRGCLLGTKFINKRELTAAKAYGKGGYCFFAA